MDHRALRLGPSVHLFSACHQLGGHFPSYELYNDFESDVRLINKSWWPSQHLHLLLHQHLLDRLQRRRLLQQLQLRRLLLHHHLLNRLQRRRLSQQQHLLQRLLLHLLSSKSPSTAMLVTTTVSATITSTPSTATSSFSMTRTSPAATTSSAITTTPAIQAPTTLVKSTAVDPASYPQIFTCSICSTILTLQTQRLQRLLLRHWSLLSNLTTGTSPWLVYLVKAGLAPVPPHFFSVPDRSGNSTLLDVPLLLQLCRSCALEFASAWGAVVVT